MSSVHFVSPWTYSWKILGVGVAAAVSSSAGSVTELTQCMMPNSVAAWVLANAASGWKTWSEPMGARMAGMRSLWPRNVVDGSSVDTSTRMRGRKAMRSKARRLRRRVVSDSEPPTR